MKWFEGDIASAVQTAKSKQTVFLVCITGSDSLSESLDVTLADESVSSECEQSGWISLQLKANSEACVQFSAIYPVVCVPCVFFIGVNGIPIEISAGSKTPEEMMQIFHRVQEQHKGTAPQSSDARQDTASSVDTISAETPQPEEAPLLEDKVERAKMLLAEKREEKARKEREDEKIKEKERVELGKNMNKLRELQKERGQREEAKLFKKEKAEEKEAKETVRRQIAQDKAERAARAVVTANENKMPTSAKKTNVVKSDIARIQFRLSDDSSITQHFSPNDTLQDAYDFLQQNVAGSPVMQLSTAYPKRTFVSGDFSQTLSDLDLTPSALIIVLLGAASSGVSRGPTSTSGNSIVGFVMMLLGPLFSVWTFLMSFLLGPPRPAPVQRESTEQPSALPKQPSGDVRSRAGNMRRLRKDEDEKDKDATWNGNSTQQM